MAAIKKILSIDIGGTNIKTSVLDKEGKLLSAYQKLPTPQPATTQAVLAVIQQLVADKKFDVISAGFPGYIKQSVIYTAPNLGTEYWKGVNLAKLLEKKLGKPARVGNDADLLGLGIVKGKGFEMVVTLGTGFGSAFYQDGKLLPHLEMAHHPIRKDKTYDEYIGQKALDRIGRQKWNERLQFVLSVLKMVFNYDTLYLGGGNAQKIDFPLEKNIKVFTNVDGIDGGARLWAQ